MTRRTAALLVGFGSFSVYFSTLLPGFDFGDSASFQVMAGSPTVTPRDAYPLYFALARPLAWAYHDPALALNVTTAIEAALASALIVLVAAELSGAVSAGVASAVLFSASYTFWSQAVTAEVYALHISLIALTLLLLLRWEKQPDTVRFVCFVAVYALSFGNHLTMVLLAPAYASFLLSRAPGGWRTLVNRRMVTLVLALTAAGSLQYLWNFHALWRAPLAPTGLREALDVFWLDVTKADWRDTMVGRVPSVMAGERLRMYAFDVWQQFGWVPPGLACVGIAWLFHQRRPRAWLMAGIFVITSGFALTYNVGDSHVFFLPSHLTIALLAAPGIVALGSLALYVGAGFSRPVEAAESKRTQPTVVAIAVLITALAIGRGYRDYPALDRSQDTRPRDVLEAVTSGLDDQHAIFLADVNWQVDNGLNYFASTSRNDLAIARMPDVLPYAPALTRDNRAAGREVLLNERAAASLKRAHVSQTILPDARVHAPALAEVARTITPGTRYVLCVLTPTRDMSLDEADIQQGVRWLTGSEESVPPGDYKVYAGVAGQPPALVHASNRPFRRSLSIGGVPATIRMDSWLAFDTIRRMGFGHVVAARRHTLIVERGVSFVTFDEKGEALTRNYWGNIFELQPRYVVR